MSLEENAKRAEEEGNLEQAFDTWHELALKSKNSVHFCHLGFVAKNLGRWSEAESAFLSALEIQPCFPIAMQGLGIVYLHRPHEDRIQDLELAKDYFARS